MWALVTVEKALKPAQKRSVVDWLKLCYKISARRACRLVRCRRATYHYIFKRADQAYLVKRIKEIAAQKPRYGYRRIHILLKREGWPINVKRVYRLYKKENLQMRPKTPKRRVSPHLRQVRVPASQQNQCWSMDFVADNLYNGQKLRCLTIVDNHTRISPAIGVGFRYTACQVVETLNQAVKAYGKPACIRVDNGPEFISKEFQKWMHDNEIGWSRIEKGKPQQNCHVERFNKTMRNGVFHRLL